MITAATLEPSDAQRYALSVLEAKILTDDDELVDLLVGSPTLYADEELGGTGDEDFIDALQRHEPLVFVLETVRGFAAPRHENFLEALVMDLEDQGYDVGYDVRKIEGRNRLLVVGIDDEADSRPYIGPGNLARILETNLERVADLR